MEKKNAKKTDKLSKHKQRLAKRSTIRMKLEITSIRAVFEVLALINTTATIIFTPSGFTIRAITGTNMKSKTGKKNKAGSHPDLCQADFTFDMDNISRYVYNLKSEDGEMLDKYEILVSADDFVARIAGLKKEALNFTVEVNEDFTNNGIIIKIPGSNGQKFLETQVPKRPKVYVNQFDKWYLGAKPVAKPFLHSFATSVASAKKCGCSEIEFCLNTRTNSMSLCGWGAPEVPLHSEPFENVNSNSSCEADNDSDASVKRTLNLEDGLLVKITKLSSGSVLKIYLDPINEEAPLILKTYVGMQGTATFSISSNPMQ